MAHNTLEERIAAIEARNQRVEDDKSWETSGMRRLLVASLTFVLVGLYLAWLGVKQPWLNALVPSIGFLLSTLAMQQAKAWWLKKRKR